MDRLPALEATRISSFADGILEVALHRPARGNAFTAGMADELDALFRAADEDARVKVVILHGGEGRYFCAGADLGGGEGGRETARDLGGVAAVSVWHCRKPTLVAIHGAAVGIGITLTLPFDIRVAERDATCGFVFASRGLSVEGASSYFLPRLVGIGKASDLCLSARKFRAAEEPSLFTHLVEKGQALAKARALAAEMLRNSSLASLVYIKRCLNAPSAGTPHGAHELESRVIAERFTSAAVAEGFSSFLEKRPANFSDTAADVDPNLDTWANWPKRYPLRKSKL